MIKVIAHTFADGTPISLDTILTTASITTKAFSSVAVQNRGAASVYFATDGSQAAANSIEIPSGEYKVVGPVARGNVYDRTEFYFRGTAADVLVIELLTL